MNKGIKITGNGKNIYIINLFHPFIVISFIVILSLSKLFKFIFVYLFSIHLSQQMTELLFYYTLKY